MKSFYNNIKDAIRYGISDSQAILLIGAIMLVTSLVNKYVDSFHISNVIMFIVVGYGSFITWHTIDGLENPPKVRNIKRLLWEGFKKSVIVVVYSIFLTYLMHLVRIFFAESNLVGTFVFAIFFAIVWMLLVLGLVNRYLNDGRILKAFDIPEIIRLLSGFNFNYFARLMISAIIAQVFVVSVCVNFHHGFSMIELLYSISTFFLAPFLFIATKRLVGLHIWVLLN